MWPMSKQLIDKILSPRPKWRWGEFCLGVLKHGLVWSPQRRLQAPSVEWIEPAKPACEGLLRLSRCLVGLLVLVGCQPSLKPVASQANFQAEESGSSTEPTFADQIADVQAGKTTTLHITQSPITAAQIAELARLSQLQTLMLDAGGVADDTLYWLNALHQLEHLRIRQATLTDAGVEQLDPATISQLKILNLPQATLTARGLRHMSQFPGLIQLRLGATAMDDTAAQELAKFPNLKSLHLIGPKFSDEALTSLAQTPKLASLYIDDCRLSDAAWKRLFDAKPNLHVHIDQQHHDRDPNQAHDAAE